MIKIIVVFLSLV